MLISLGSIRKLSITGWVDKGILWVTTGLVPSWNVHPTSINVYSPLSTGPKLATIWSLNPPINLSVFSL